MTASAFHDGGVRRSIGVGNPDGQAAASITNQLELVGRHRSAKFGWVIALEVGAMENILSPLIELDDGGAQHNSQHEKDGYIDHVQISK